MLFVCRLEGHDGGRLATVVAAAAPPVHPVLQCQRCPGQWCFLARAWYLPREYDAAAGAQTNCCCRCCCWRHSHSRCTFSTSLRWVTSLIYEPFKPQPSARSDFSKSLIWTSSHTEPSSAVQLLPLLCISLGGVRGRFNAIMYAGRPTVRAAVCIIAQSRVIPAFVFAQCGKNAETKPLLQCRKWFGQNLNICGKNWCSPFCCRTNFV